MQVGQAPGASLALVAIGAGMGTVPVAGCQARMLPLLGTLAPMVLSGSGAGTGSGSVTLPLPSGLPPAAITLTAQAFVFDASVAGGLNASNARTLVIF